MSIDNRKIAVVALSGGVDSSVVALLLQQQGYKVIGLTGKMVNTFAAEEVCNNAKNVANKLGIEHYVLDVCDKFKKMVIEYFEDSYKNGQTPNPCIVCNEFIKWGELFDYAVDVLKADIFATGHYADIRFVDGVYKLYPAKDEHKDQLYFLHRLNQKQLSKTVFPLYDYEKEDVRKYAIENNIPVAQKQDSQENSANFCFFHSLLPFSSNHS